jgi:very-short-patch-repair endonuclease
MVTTTDWTGAQRASTLAAIAAAESPAEAALLVHLLFALDGDTYAVGGPGCSWRLTTQLKVTVERGRYRLDIALERDPHRVCVEVDGYAYHSTEAQKAHDAARELALKATGWTVIRVAAWRSFEEPGAVVREILGRLQEIEARGTERRVSPAEQTEEEFAETEAMFLLLIRQQTESGHHEAARDNLTKLERMRNVRESARVARAMRDIDPNDRAKQDAMLL